ncbi:MAG: hypothetical protein JOY93_06845 [Acidobacteriales bacterium]|nr:hypothetical protein [Terriglobales bacterium]
MERGLVHAAGDVSALTQQFTQLQSEMTWRDLIALYRPVIQAFSVREVAAAAV